MTINVRPTVLRTAVPMATTARPELHHVQTTIVINPPHLVLMMVLILSVLKIYTKTEV